MELAELDHVLTSSIEGRRLGPTEIPDPATFERAGRRRGARRLISPTLGTKRWLASEAFTGAGVRARLRPRGRLVARTVRGGRVDAAGDRPRRPRSRWTTTTTRRAAHIGRGSSLRLGALQIPDERGVRIIDLGHLPGGDPRGGRIVAGQVGVMGPSELPPGGLDVRRIRPTNDAEHLVRIPFGHARSVPMRAQAERCLTRSLDSPSWVPSPTT